MAQRHRGIDLKIAQNCAIFEKMAQEKLRILHENFVRGNSELHTSIDSVSFV